MLVLEPSTAPLLLYLLKALALKHSINSAYPDCIAQHANVGIVRGISTREFHDRYGGIVHGISLVGFGYGRLSNRVTMLSAAWRQIFEEACEEKGNLIDGIEAEEEVEVEFSGDGIEEMGGMAMRQQEGVMDVVAGAGEAAAAAAADPRRGSRSQWRRRKMGMSLKALKRWVFIRALCSLISAIYPIAFDAATSGESNPTTGVCGIDDDDEALHRRSREVVWLSSSCIRCEIQDVL